MELLEQVASGITKLMGDDTEVVLHDLKKREVVYIAHGSITGRTRAYRINPAVYDVISTLADGEGHLIGYASKATNGKKLRSSHFMFTDENNEPVAMLCVNQDTASVEHMIDYLSDQIRLKPMEENQSEEENNSLLDENYIMHVTQKAIHDSIEQMKPQEVTSREGKMELLRRLKFQGIFNVKDAVPYVCGVLSISQATLYNYLRELRNEEASELINELKQR